MIQNPNKKSNLGIWAGSRDSGGERVVCSDKYLVIAAIGLSCD